MYKLGVIGDPVNHSLSPKIHNIFALQTNTQINYQSYHVIPEKLDNFIDEFFKNGGDGLNVTLPHKIDCLRTVKKSSPIVNLIGAANTLKFVKSSQEIFADSTDGRGLVKDLKNKFSIDLANILILGAGGSALSIIPSLDACSPKNIILDNRSNENLKNLMERFNNSKEIKTNIVKLENFNEEIDLIINATSAGFSGAFSWQRDLRINHKTVLYDLNYSNDDRQTPFIEWGSQFSKNYFDGFGMLINQAAISFELWTGKMPDIKINKLDLKND